MKNKKLRDALVKEVNERKAMIRRLIQEARDSVAPLEPLADQLDEAGIEYHAITSALFISVPYDLPKTKPVFTEQVKRVARALSALPDMYVGESTYRATFCDGKVWLSMYSPEDCQVIEVEETVTRKVLKPHPGCVAALSALEDAVF